MWFAIPQAALDHVARRVVHAAERIVELRVANVSGSDNNGLLEFTTNMIIKCPTCQGFLTGRHCLTNGCGYTRPQSQEELVRTGQLKPHRKVEPEDGQALINVLKTYGLTLPRNAIEWRTASLRGTLPSLNLSVEMVATDGVLAWFVQQDGRAFVGHVENFEEHEQEKPEKKKSKRQQLLDMI